MATLPLSSSVCSNIPRNGIDATAFPFWLGAGYGMIGLLAGGQGGRADRIPGAGEAPTAPHFVGNHTTWPPVVKCLHNKFRADFLPLAHVLPRRNSHDLRYGRA